jgi:hypothetical protein
VLELTIDELKLLIDTRVRDGLSQAAIMDWLSNLELEKAIATEAEEYVQSLDGHGHTEDTPKDKRPPIVVSNRQLRDPTMEATIALYRANDPPFIFVRQGKLMNVALDERHRPYIDLVNKAALRNQLTKVANFYRVEIKNEKKHLINVPPPDNITESILAQSNNSFPPLENIIECPVLRPDGTIITKAGYDSMTRLYHYPAKDLKLPDIPTNPSVTELVAAIDLVKEIVCNYEFETVASEANYYAAMFTPILRPIIKGVTPLHLFDKAQAGSGATILANIVSIIATGQSAALMTAQKDDESWRKAIFSLLLRGQPIVTIDNVEHTLMTPSLAALITAETFQDRVLGRSEMMTLPNQCTLIATGNNIKLAGDMPRRCVLVRINPRVPHPWRRDPSLFVHPELESWVKEKRGDILAAMLTIATAWVRAGKPKPCHLPSFGSFESWAQIVGGVLDIMMVDGFLGNLDTIYEEMDTDTPVWENFLQVWFDTIGSEPITTPDLIAKMEDLNYKSLADAVPVPSEKNEKSANYARRLGWAFRKKLEVVYPSLLMLTKDKDTYRKAIRYKVVKVVPKTGTKP